MGNSSSQIDADAHNDEQPREHSERIISTANNSSPIDATNRHAPSPKTWHDGAESGALHLPPKNEKRKRRSPSDTGHTRDERTKKPRPTKKCLEVEDLKGPIQDPVPEILDSQTSAAQAHAVQDEQKQQEKVKRKRKRRTGRPSGLDLYPMVYGTQDDPVPASTNETASSQLEGDVASGNQVESLSKQKRLPSKGDGEIVPPTPRSQSNEHDDQMQVADANRTSSGSMPAVSLDDGVGQSRPDTRNDRSSGLSQEPGTSARRRASTERAHVELRQHKDSPPAPSTKRSTKRSSTKGRNELQQRVRSDVRAAIPDEIDVEGAKLPKAVKQSKSGAFTSDERAFVELAFEETVKSRRISDQALRAAIQQSYGSEDVAHFKRLLEEALVGRSKASIRKFCQRNYHTYSRGPWTQEEDRLLKNAHAANPGKWTEVASVVGRRAEDCRDRWRDVTGWQDAHAGPWTRVEEADLLRAVDKSIEAIREANKRDSKLLEDDEALFALINWTHIGSELKDTRTAKHCRSKYSKLKQRQKSKHFGAGNAKAVLVPSEQPLTKRTRIAKRKYASFDVGDIFEVLREILHAIPDPSTRYQDESTFWSVVAIRNKGSRFDSVLRRHALAASFEMYINLIQDEDTLASAAARIAGQMKEDYGTETLVERRRFKGRNHLSSKRVEDSDQSSDDGNSDAKANQSDVEDQEPEDTAESKSKPSDNKTNEVGPSHGGSSAKNRKGNPSVQDTQQVGGGPESLEEDEQESEQINLEVGSVDSDSYKTPRLSRKAFTDRIKKARATNPVKSKPESLVEKKSKKRSSKQADPA